MNDEERTNSGQFPAAGCAKGLATQKTKEAYQTVYLCSSPDRNKVIIENISKEMLQQRRMLRPCQTSTVEAATALVWQTSRCTSVRATFGDSTGEDARRSGEAPPRDPDCAHYPDATGVRISNAHRCQVVSRICCVDAFDVDKGAV